VYNYAIFFEDGTRDAFYLNYGPVNEDRPGSAAIIYDWKNDEHLKRFDGENEGRVMPMLQEMHDEHCIGFIMVNPPTTLSELLKEADA
jgi:hypothetical protein